MKLVPPDKRTENILFAMVSSNGWLLREIPPYQQTPALYLNAVSNIGTVLSIIPEAQQTDELRLEAVKQSWEALEHIPIELRTDVFCSIGLEQSIEALQWVPQIKQTEEFCLHLLNENKQAIQFIHPEQLTVRLCVEAIKQNWQALEWVPQKLRAEVLGNEEIAKIMLSNSFPLQTFLNTKDTPAMKAKLEQIQEEMLKKCKIVILQLDQDDAELEDIHHIYAAKRENQGAICVRNERDLKTLLGHLAKIESPNNINLALVGHHSLATGMKIAGMKPPTIASLASNNPIIKGITLLGCYTARGEALPEEEKNAKQHLAKREDLKKEIISRYPNSSFKKNNVRLNALVDDILWQDGKRSCGAAVMVESESKITPDNLRQALPDSLDSAYIFLKNKDNNYASYYLERGLAGIQCTCISEKLEEDQMESLRQIEGFEKGAKNNKMHLMDESVIEGNHWCSNKKGRNNYHH